MQTIPIKAINLKAQKPTEVKDLFLEIHETHLRYVYVLFADEPNDTDDEGLGWHNEFNSIDVIARKQFVSGIEKCWVEISKVWGVYVMVTGFASDLKIFVKKESEAQEIYETLIKWLLQ